MSGAVNTRAEVGLQSTPIWGRLLTEIALLGHEKESNKITTFASAKQTMTTRKKEIKIYFTASSPPLGTPTPETDPHERHAHNWREPNPEATRKRKEKFAGWRI
jgi:hypothetical protein